MVAWLVDVGAGGPDDDARWGGKARSLARLAAAGLATPPAFVVTDDLFRALRAGGPPLPGGPLDAAALVHLDEAAAALVAAPFPDGFAAALAARLSALGERFSVRSSFASEDAAGGLAPGVYLSRVGVAAAEVERALREVLASALSPAAVAYARAHGVPPAAPPVAVLIHRHVAGDAWGSAALDPGHAPAIEVTSGEPSPLVLAAIERAVLALATRHGAVEVEWVASGAQLTFLQLRPYQAPAPARAWPGLAELAPGAPGDPPPAAWRWDAAHNPLPLSPAQAGLVALVDERCRTGTRQRVAGGGYLFVAAGGPPPPPAVAAAGVRAAFDELRARADAGLAALPAPADPAALEQALALFVSIYEPLFGVVQPAARAARRALADFLDRHAPPAAAHLPALLAGVESLATERHRRARDLAAYLDLFGDEAPGWDVALPTFRERPPQLRPAPDPAPAPWRAAADQLFSRLEPAARREAEQHLAAARAAVAVGEDDDWLYARVQAAVRRALLALGDRLHAAGALAARDDVFLLPLPLARALAAGAPAPPDTAAIAARARAALAAARRDPPPSPQGPARATFLRGAGTGGRAIGRVALHRADAPAIDRSDLVLVADTLLPTELPLLSAAALVTETGGPLDHVAAQARERALPAVVGAAGATRLLQPGDLVLVDADQGVVIRLAPGEAVTP